MSLVCHAADALRSLWKRNALQRAQTCSSAPANAPARASAVQTVGAPARGTMGCGLGGTRASVAVLVVMVLPSSTAKLRRGQTCKASETGIGWDCQCPEGDGFEECTRLKQKRLLDVASSKVAFVSDFLPAVMDVPDCTGTTTSSRRRLRWTAEDEASAVMDAFQSGGRGDSRLDPFHASHMTPTATQDEWLEALNATGPRGSKRGLSVAEDFSAVSAIQDAASAMADAVEAWLRQYTGFDTIKCVTLSGSQHQCCEEKACGYAKGMDLCMSLKTFEKSSSMTNACSPRVSKEIDGVSLYPTRDKLKTKTSAYRKFLDWCGEKLKTCREADCGKLSEKNQYTPGQHTEGDSPGKHCNNDAYCLTDLLRFTVIGKDVDTLVKVLQAVRGSTKDDKGVQTFIEAGWKNYWLAGNNYLGINDVYGFPVPLKFLPCDVQEEMTKWKDEKCNDGAPIVAEVQGVGLVYYLRVEVQYHTECSMNIKQDVTHDMYEILRDHTRGASYTCKEVQAMSDQALFVNWNYCSTKYYQGVTDASFTTLTRDTVHVTAKDLRAQDKPPGASPAGLKMWGHPRDDLLEQCKRENTPIRGAVYLSSTNALCQNYPDCDLAQHAGTPYPTIQTAEDAKESSDPPRPGRQIAFWSMDRSDCGVIKQAMELRIKEENDVIPWLPGYKLERARNVLKPQCGPNPPSFEQSMMAVADANGDGQISKAELKGGLHPLTFGYPDLAGSSTAGNPASRALTISWFTEMDEEDWPSPSQLANAVADDIFSHADRDADGDVDDAELAQWDPGESFTTNGAMYMPRPLDTPLGRRTVVVAMHSYKRDLEQTFAGHPFWKSPTREPFVLFPANTVPQSFPTLGPEWLVQPLSAGQVASAQNIPASSLRFTPEETYKDFAYHMYVRIYTEDADGNPHAYRIEWQEAFCFWKKKDLLESWDFDTKNKPSQVLFESTEEHFKLSSPADLRGEFGFPRGFTLSTLFLGLFGLAEDRNPDWWNKPWDPASFNCMHFAKTVYMFMTGGNHDSSESYAIRNKIYDEAFSYLSDDSGGLLAKDLHSWYPALRFWKDTERLRGMAWMAYWGGRFFKGAHDGGEVPLYNRFYNYFFDEKPLTSSQIWSKMPNRFVQPRAKGRFYDILIYGGMSARDELHGIQSEKIVKFQLVAERSPEPTMATSKASRANHFRNAIGVLINPRSHFNTDALFD